MFFEEIFLEGNPFVIRVVRIEIPIRYTAKMAGTMAAAATTLTFTCELKKIPIDVDMVQRSVV